MKRWQAYTVRSTDDDKPLGTISIKHGTDAHSQACTHFDRDDISVGYLNEGTGEPSKKTIDLTGSR